MKVGVIAGEASGDVLGAQLIQVLRAQYPNLQVEGIGGPLMIAAGCRSLFDMERLSVLGLIEPLKRLPDLLRLRRDICKHFLTSPPDIFIGIDSPDFNLGIELKLRKAGIRTMHYVSPSVWAWRQGRIHKIKKAVDRMLTVFPFEATFYEKHEVPVTYVGHPLAEKIPLEIDSTAARAALSLEQGTSYVALLPGSRRQELHYLAKSMLEAAVAIRAERPEVKFITSHVSTEMADIFASYQQQIAPSLPLHSFVRKTSEVMAASDVVVVASGTATLETMLYKKPMVVVYRLSALSYHLLKWLVHLPHLALPNILANERLVPEYLQKEVTAENISKQVLEYFDKPQETKKLIERFIDLHCVLKRDTANAILDAVSATIR